VPTIITHTIVAGAAGLSFAPKGMPARFWALSAFCSMIPDADVVAFFFGIPYSHSLGHRGFFHSPFFGLLLSIVVVLLFFREAKFLSRRWLLLMAYFTLVTSSHGLLDAFTGGGLGIALLAPFDSHRYFFPWTPIVVSPIGIRAMFSTWGLEVMRSELVWVWLPCLFVMLMSALIRSAWFKTGSSSNVSCG
jgi:inner membrane protein